MQIRIQNFILLTVFFTVTSYLTAQEGYYLKITNASNAAIIGKEIKVEGSGDWHRCVPLGQTFTAQLTDPYLGGPPPLAPLNGNVGVCKRGTYWYIDKAKNIQEAGGVGMVQINDTRPPLEHMIGVDPAVHIWAISIDDAEEQLFHDNNFLQFEFIFKKNTRDQVYWGDLPGQGDFSNGLGGWTTTSDCEAAVWKVSVNGYSKGAYGENWVASPTACDGAAYFQSDSLQTGGHADSTGPCPVHQFNHFTSPKIDLSQVPADQVLSLQFFSAARQYYSKYWVAWSDDDGATWDSTEINQDLKVNDGHFSRKMRVRLKGIEHTDQVRIRFIYDANYYFWVLDDIKIVKLEDYNVKLPVESNWFAGPVMVQNPKSQQTTNVWMTDVENAGGKTATNVNLIVTVRDTATKALIYNYKHELGDIPSGDTVQNIVSQGLTFVTPNAPGVYEIEYRVTMDSSDYDDKNNSHTMLWMITDSTWAQEIAYTNAYTVGNDQNGHSRLIGNIYRVENESPNLSFDHIAVGYNVSSDALAGIGAEIRIYEYEDINNDKQVNSTEMTGGQYIATSEFAVGAKGNHIDTMRLYDLNYDPVTIKMKPGKSYIVGMNFVNDINDDYIFQMVDERYNFQATEYAQALLDEEKYYRPVSIFQSTETLTDFNISRGRYSVLGTYMRVWTPDRLAANKSPLLQSQAMKLFPTIARHFINVEFNLANTEDAAIQITDINGSVVYRTKFQQVRDETVSVQFGNLPDGKYLLRAETKYGVVVKPFTVVN